MKRKWLCMLLCVCMITTMFVGCSGDDRLGNKGLDEDINTETLMLGYIEYLKENYGDDLVYAKEEGYRGEVYVDVDRYFALYDVNDDGICELFYKMYVDELIKETEDIASFVRLDRLSGVLTYNNGKIVDNSFDFLDFLALDGYVDGYKYFSVWKDYKYYLVHLDKDGEVVWDAEYSNVLEEVWNDEKELYEMAYVGFDYIPVSEKFELSEEELNEVCNALVRCGDDGWFNSIDDLTDYIESKDWKN